MTGVFHSPDGRVLTGQTGPVFGNNVVFNIVNSYTINPNLPDQALAQADPADATKVLTRKLLNQAKIRDSSEPAESGTLTGVAKFK